MIRLKNWVVQYFILLLIIGLILILLRPIEHEGQDFQNLDEHDDIFSKNANNDSQSKVEKRQLKRKQHLRKYCKEHADAENSWYVHWEFMLYNDAEGIVNCIVPKAAATNWKKMWLVFEGVQRDANAIKDKELVHKYEYPRLDQLSRAEAESRLRSYYSFMFVRHPFERLLSTYRNKLLDPYNTVYQLRWGSMMLRQYSPDLPEEELRAGKNVTFKNFIDYLILVHENYGHVAFDIHWQVQHLRCTPCSIKYDYIGKMETLTEDADQIIKELGLEDKVKFPISAKDKYQTDIKTLMKKYYSDIPKGTLQKLYKIYEGDFLAFRYRVPDFMELGRHHFGVPFGNSADT